MSNGLYHENLVGANIKYGRKKAGKESMFHIFKAQQQNWC
jgi:hypothetical protein